LLVSSDAYLSDLEESYHSPDGPVGWQHFGHRLGKTPERREDSHERKISDGTLAFWITLLLVTLAVAIWEVFVVQAPAPASLALQVSAGSQW
jgi:hypothetical protein